MKIKYQTLLLPAVLMLGACSGEELVGSSDKMGSVSLVGVEVSNAEEVINSAGSSRAVTDVSNYIVDFCRQGETEPVQSYVYADMPGTVELPEGVYTASVRSHDLLKAEYERPYFQGASEEFTVVAGKTTEVDPVRCTFKALKVSIVFGEELKQKMGTDVKVTVVANDEGMLEFTPNDKQSGYFAAIDGSVTLVATFTGTVNGHFENFFKTYTDVAAGQHRIITYELNGNLPVPDQPSGTIGGDGISVDVKYEDVDLSGDVNPGTEDTLPEEDEPGKLPDIPGGPDVPDNPEVPDTPAEPITFGGTIEDGAVYMNTDFVTPDDVVIKQALVVINCEKGCKEVDVKIDSNTLTPELLTSVGLTNQFKLVADTQLYEAVGGLGLPCGDAVKNQPTVNFDITSFMSLLGIYPDGQSKFTLTVTDNEDNVKTCSFNINTL